MLPHLKTKTYNLLRWTENWTKTDMVYLAKGGSWLTLGQVISSIFYFALSIAFANLLPKETYGTYKYILSIVMVLSIPTLGSMSTAVLQAIARGYEGSIIPALKTKIKWGLLGGLASLLLAFYYFINEDKTLSTAFFIVSFFIPFYNAFKIYSSLLHGRKNFKALTKFGIVFNVLFIGIFVLILFNTNNLFLLLIYYFFGQYILNSVFLFSIFRIFRPNKKQDPRTIPYGIHLSLLGIFLKIVNEADKILLWHYLGPVQLAIYSFANAPIQQISGLVGGNISTLAFPKLSKSPIKDLKKTLPKKIVKFFIIIIPIVLIYIFLSPLFFKIFYPQYLESIKYSQLFALTLLFIPTSLLGSTLIAKMKKKEITIIRTISPSFRIILLLIFTPLYGIFGVIISQILASLFHLLLITILFKNTKDSEKIYETF
ncbi:oligosaccharide flippase family protein [bacterium]|nr:oligosaccharide flippase family protein [bacterium]